MICIIAMVIFGILSIFSAKYRPLAKESFDCVFRRVTFRKCQSDLDSRIKGKLVGKLMTQSPTSAKLLYKHFETISWIFVILFFVSLFFTGQAVYNLVVYDNCNGPNADPGTCIFTPDNGNPSLVTCGDPACENGTCELCGQNCSCASCV